MNQPRHHRLSLIVVVQYRRLPAVAQKIAPQGAKVLLLSGGKRQHHGYRDQALYLSATLENTGRYQVTICEDAAILETPAMDKYDLLIVNADRRDDEFKFTRVSKRLFSTTFVQGMATCRFMRPTTPPRIGCPTGKKCSAECSLTSGLPDGKTRKGSFVVKIADTCSPITQGLKDFNLTDELYYQVQMMPDVEPLATIEYQGATWPVAWVRTFGKGRVFHTVLGHRDFGPEKDDPVRNPESWPVSRSGNRLGRRWPPVSRQALSTRPLNRHANASIRFERVITRA